MSGIRGKPVRNFTLNVIGANIPNRKNKLEKKKIVNKTHIILHKPKFKSA